jgi:energy-coupling factor transporter ATP-binding protein EcfA2
VGALIEVGSGLHPELTGRENIHLYGNIMGISRADIDRRFDDIVDFAGIGNALGQPLKQYSSGMQLRLGFSVAAFLEPDVLLVDEAIAVGDAAFQRKCIERMQELTAEGRTLVFVSHDMYAVEALCARSLWLRNGQVVGLGRTTDIIKDYLLSVHDERLMADHTTGAVTSDELDILSITLHDDTGVELDRAQTDAPLVFRIRYRTRKRLVRPGFSLGISTGGMYPFTIASMVVDDRWLPNSIEGEGIIDCRFENLPLQPGAYELWGSVRTADGYSDYITWQRFRMFAVRGEIDGRGTQALTAALTLAPVRMPHSWHLY